MNFSVIIPTLNEEGSIQSCLRAVHAADSNAEIVVVDCGSRDATAKIVRNEGATFSTSQQGRGIQFNLGASTSNGEILVFLHADTIVAPDLFEVLRRSFEMSDVEIGTCRLQFDLQHPILRFYSACARFKSVLTTFGDQCIVVRRSFFDMIGGFPKLRLFEDVGLLQKARKHTRIHSFPTTVVTSARRFAEQGIVRQQLRNAAFMGLYLGGVAPDVLAAAYARERRKPAVSPSNIITFNHQHTQRREPLCDHNIG